MESVAGRHKAVPSLRSVSNNVIRRAIHQAISVPLCKDTTSIFHIPYKICNRERSVVCFNLLTPFIHVTVKFGGRMSPF